LASEFARRIQVGRVGTKQKSLMQRWPQSMGKGAEFVMPTAK